MDLFAKDLDLSDPSKLKARWEEIKKEFDTVFAKQAEVHAARRAKLKAESERTGKEFEAQRKATLKKLKADLDKLK